MLVQQRRKKKEGIDIDNLFNLVSIIVKPTSSLDCCYAALNLETCICFLSLPLLVHISCLFPSYGDSSPGNGLPFWVFVDGLSSGDWS